MRQNRKKAWIALFAATALLEYFGMGAARGADPIDMPAPPPPPPVPQAPASPDTPAPQEQGKGERRKAIMHRMKEACGKDIQKLCPDVKPGAGRIVQCLEQHQAEVSQNCNQLLAKKGSRQGKGR